MYQPYFCIPYTETKAGYKITPLPFKPCLEQLKEEKGYAPYYTFDGGDKENFIKVGSPTVLNKIASNFSNGNYLQSLIPISDNDKITVDVTFTYKNTGALQQVFCVYGSLFRLVIESSGAISSLLSGANRVDYYYQPIINIIQDNDIVRYVVTITKDGAKSKIYINGEFIAEEERIKPFSPAGTTWRIGAHINDGKETFSGTIDLSKFKVYVNNRLWTPYTRPQYTLPQGDVYSVLSAKANSSEIAEYSMPSETFESLTLGEPETTYTSPANGWFVFSKVAGDANKYVQLRNLSNNMREDSKGTHAEDVLSVYLPVKKGDFIMADYNATGDLWQFGFIYAEGEI